jgi:hypothetical protein
MKAADKRARRELMINLKKRRSAQDFLSWIKIVSKIGPFTVKPGRTGARVDDIDFGDWRAQAKYAAQLFTRPNPEHFKEAIRLAAEVMHKQFFIDLGKCLSGDIDPELWDKRDIDIAEIVLSNPRISAKNAVRELEKRNHHGITEENFRNWKSKLLKAKREYDAFRIESSGLLKT